jgi:adenosylcobinamide kinase/adenosylcobinamide-phosphate guanylyltransferase
MKQLILGGARSGKSAFAERLARESGLAVIYVATAAADDSEMAARITQHRRRRPAEWRTIEAPLQLAQALQLHAATDHFVIVDCLTLWLSNLIHAGERGDERFDLELCAAERRTLLELLPALPGEIVLVSNELGMGVVPMGKLSRLFVDEAGRLNQETAARCERVTWMAAGLPLTLKAPGQDRGSP